MHFSATDSQRFSIKAIPIAADVRRQLADAYDRAYPVESCGFLLGWPRKITLLVESLNAVSLPGGFDIPDREIIRVRLIASNSGVQIKALFHSHPEGSTELSQNDCDALRHSQWPWVVITRTACGKLRLTWYAHFREPANVSCLRTVLAVADAKIRRR